MGAVGSGSWVPDVLECSIAEYSYEPVGCVKTKRTSNNDPQ